MSRKSQNCRKSEEPEIGTSSKVGTRESEIGNQNFISELGRKKTSEIGNWIKGIYKGLARKEERVVRYGIEKLQALVINDLFKKF